MTRDQHRTTYAAVHRKLEVKYAVEFNREIRKQYTAFLSAANEHGIETARHNIDRIVTMEGIPGALKRLYRSAGWIESNRVFSSLIKAGYRQKRLGSSSPEFSIGFDSIADVVDEYFKLFLFNRSAIPITETSKAYIRRHLLAEIDAGKPYDDAVSDFNELAITGAWNQSAQSFVRANTIALTETTKAMSFGGLMGAYMSGVDVDKEWVTSDDEHVRGQPNYAAPFWHTALDRQSAPLMGAFYNGERIKFPGDPDANIKNIIRCRCSNFYKEKSRPKPRVTGRQITQFLTDFFIGFLTGQTIEAVTADTTDDGV